MMRQNLCPCCSQPLLRHISFKRIYWFCNHCYQEMPDVENLLETKLAAKHWITQTIKERYQSEERLYSSSTVYPSHETNQKLKRLACLDSKF